ncbi:MAG TPA: DUF5615 family PIN-like protein [Burkholderiales bacterium]|nr:DUF5615 family PIN-like protein [Burkholderiales bacterium]
MKLLFDENLSPRLIELLAADFPASTHVEHLDMRGAVDIAIWSYARDHGYMIVSKDNDFRQYAFSMGRRRRFSGWLSATQELQP